MTTGNNAFQMQTGSSWKRGLDNLLRAEFGRWFKTKMWWIQILIWAALINLLVFFMAVVDSGVPAPELLMIFNIFLGLFGAVGVCIIMQGTIVGEKSSGTAAWVLSKPASRPAFLFAKLLANSAGIAVTIILAQGLIAYLIITLTAEISMGPLAYLGGLGVHLVNFLFYITLTLMLGTLFSHRAPVIGIPLVFLFVQQMILGIVPALVYVLPWTLTVPMNEDQFPSIAVAVMTGTEPLTYVPLAVTFCASVVFTVVAVWAFNRQEF